MQVVKRCPSMNPIERSIIIKLVVLALINNFHQDTIRESYKTLEKDAITTQIITRIYQEAKVLLTLQMDQAL